MIMWVYDFLKQKWDIYKEMIYPLTLVYFSSFIIDDSASEAPVGA